MYRKILVAYNGAPESRLALDEAVRIAPDASVEVHLAAVVHYPSAYLLAGEYVPEVALADEREHMEADLRTGNSDESKAKYKGYASLQETATGVLGACFSKEEITKVLLPPASSAPQN